MKLPLFIFLGIFFSLISNAQVAETNPTTQGGNLWLFGKNVWINFEGDSLHQKETTGTDILEGTTSYTKDSTAFYLTGDGGQGSMLKVNNFSIPTYFDAYGTQSVLFIVHQESKQLRIFNSSRTGGCGYSFLINDSTESEFYRLPLNGGEKQQAINHQNGSDIWYANHAREGDSIYFFLIKEQGMIECPVVTYTGLEYTGGPMGWSTQGQMKFSPDGKYLAEAVYVDPFGVGLYSFDSEYPKTDKIFIHSKGFVPPYTKRWFSGIEFSPDNSRLYINSGKLTSNPQEPDPVVLYQLDLTHLQQHSIDNSWTSLDSLFGIDQGNLQIAPNGKIYVAMPNKTYLGVINNPNELGTACNYVRQGLSLDSGGISRYGLPTFNQSYFHTPRIDFSYEEDCFTNTYTFKGLDTFGGSSFEWRIRDVRSQITETRSQKNCVFTFAADSLENTYEVTFITSNGSVSDSVTKVLTIRPKLTNNFLGSDTFYCANAQDDFELNLTTPPNLHCIHWGINGEVLEPYSNLTGDTVIGYENFYGHIHANQTLTVDTAGVYTARITNKAFCRAWDTIVVREEVSPLKSVVRRAGNQLNSSISAAEYRWYFNGNLKLTTTDSQLDPDQNGYWQVQLVSEYGCESELSDSFLVGFASVQEVSDQLSEVSFKVYPNPSDGQVTIEVSDQLSEVSVQIFDINGKLVYSQQPNNSRLITIHAKLATGNYILTLTNENGEVGSEQITVR